MSLHDLTIDTIVSICCDIVNEDTKNKVIGKFKTDVLAMIAEKNLRVSTICECDNHDTDIIDDFIYDYIKNLSQKDKDSILSDYGIMKAIVLFLDHRRYGCGDSAEEICEFLEDEKYGMYESMIRLIICDEINFQNDWRNNGN
jgi:hypothetical protein